MRANGLNEAAAYQNTTGLSHADWANVGASIRLHGVHVDHRGHLVSALGTSNTGASLTNEPIWSIGYYNYDGTGELILHQGTWIKAVRGGSSYNLVQVNTATGPHDAYRFIQHGSTLFMLNGTGGNYKYDGHTVTRMGMTAVPTAPTAQLADSGAPDTHMMGCMVGGEDVGKVRYKLTFITQSGHETEASAPSPPVDTSNVAATNQFGIAVNTAQDPGTVPDEVTDMLIYRSIDYGPYTLLDKLPGTEVINYYDTTPFAAASADAMAATGENAAPPIARTGFVFDGRVYFIGVRDNPSYAYYSRLVDGVADPESVGGLNFVDVSSTDGDVITGAALSQDFAVLFKTRSIHMLTHDKSKNPVVTPVATGFGAVGDRAITSLSGTIFFASESGLHVFNGSTVKTLLVWGENELAFSRANAHHVFAWSEPRNRRVYFSVPVENGPVSTMVLSISLDTNAITTIPIHLTAAHVVGDITFVGVDNFTSYTLDMWEHGGNTDKRTWQTVFNVNDPTTTKTFKRIELFYRQTGAHDLTVSWYVDWDDRVPVGSTTVQLLDPTALKWNSGNWDSTVMWDFDRLRSVRIDLNETHGRCISFKFEGARFALVGYKLDYADLGARPGGLDDEAY